MRLFLRSILKPKPSTFVKHTKTPCSSLPTYTRFWKNKKFSVKQKTEKTQGEGIFKCHEYFTVQKKDFSTSNILASYVNFAHFQVKTFQYISKDFSLFFSFLSFLFLNHTPRNQNFMWNSGYYCCHKRQHDCHWKRCSVTTGLSTAEWTATGFAIQNV